MERPLARTGRKLCFVCCCVNVLIRLFTDMFNNNKKSKDLLLIITIILLNCNICVELWVTGISETSIPVARCQCGSHAHWSLKGLSIHACRKYRFIKTNNEII